jgi:anti-anti-sigma factor
VLAPELSDLPEFSLTTANLNGSIVISVCGEMDMTTAPQLEEALAACDGQPVVVDLTELTFIDSTGLHVLLQDREKGKPAAVVVVPESHVARVFDIVYASKSVELCGDLQAAIHASGRGA